VCRRCEADVPEDALYCHLCGGDVTSGESTDAHERLRERLAASVDGRYRVLGLLGAGGMGVVFLAEDLERHRSVAIKVLLPELAGDSNVVERFGREARTAAALDHPGIVRIYEHASDRGLHYFVMQYVEGRTLEDVLQHERRVSIDFATRVLCEAADALASAHRNGVVHRDVKPANIIIDGKGRVLLADFGISKVARTAASDATTMLKLTDTGGIVGTPHYMAPEHALGQAVDGRTDQYALAVVGFQMLAGRLPFDDETAPAIIHLHINAAAPPLASFRDDVPPHLGAAIARAMSKSPSHRFPTIEEFVDEVAGPSAKRPARRAARWAAALLLTTGLAGGAWWIWKDRGAPERPPVAATPAGTPAKPAAAAVTRAKTPAAIRGGTKTPGAAPAATKQPAITLSVTSTPAATVYIDGRRIGMTPVAKQAVTGVGNHYVRLERTGYRTMRDTIRVTKTQTVRRNYVLRRAQR
jgi:hypothetical protein